MASPCHAGRVGDGVRENIGLGGVARSGGRIAQDAQTPQEACVRGRRCARLEASWLGPAPALLGPASLVFVVPSSTSSPPPLPRNFRKYLTLIFSDGGLYAALPATIEVRMAKNCGSMLGSLSSPAREKRFSMLASWSA